MKIRGSSIAVATAMGIMVRGVVSENPPSTYDPVKQFCRRFYHQAAKIGSRLYMDGGLVTALNGDHNKNYTNNLLTFHNLADDSDRAAPLVNNLTKPAEAPSVVGGALWADETNEKLYLFGGEYPDGLPTNVNDPQAVWSYDPWDDKWSKVKVSGEFLRPSFGSHVSVNQLGQGFYLGGWLGPNNVPGWKGPRKALNNLIVYDFVHQTATNMSGPDFGPPRVEGELFYVPVGDSGLLVSFGGMYAKDGNENDVTPAPLEEIDVYDISQGLWARVNATGTIPGQRRRFCGGLTSAQDESSHNVYIYGGASITGDSPGQDDVHILTMPAFRWILFQKNQGDAVRYHNGFSCTLLNKGQMAVIGGTFPHDTQFCDMPSSAGSHYMDLGKSNKDGAEWYGYRKNLKTYDLPDDITKVIGGGPSGKATLTTPQGGFSNSDLSILFKRQLSVEERQPTRTPTAEPNKSTSSSKSTPANVGIIVGPAVGVAVPALVGLLGLFLFRRRQQRRKRAGNQPLNFKGHGGYRGNVPSNLTIPTTAYQLPTTQSPITRGPAGYHGQYPPNGTIYPMPDGKFQSPNGAPMAQPGYGFEQYAPGQMASPTELPGHTVLPQELAAGPDDWRDSVAMGTVKTGRTIDARRRGSSATSEELVYGREMQNKEMGGMI